MAVKSGRKHPAPKRRPPRSTARTGAAADPLVQALARAGWAEADDGLAQALAEAAVLLHQMQSPAAKARALASARESADFLFQALQSAARRRGLALFGEAGALVAYEASRHAYEGAARAPNTRVRILAPGVARDGVVILKARVRPAPAARARR